MKIVLLDAFTADQGTEAWPGLSDLGDVTRYDRTPPAELHTRCQGAAAIITNKAPLDGAAIAALPDLRFIGVSATGTNIIDLPAARARGIAVTNVPGYSTDSVAHLVFAFILHLSLDVSAHAADVKAGGWSRREDFAYFLRPLHELAGKTLVIVGRGAIGSAVERIAIAFGMKVLAAAVPGSPSPGRVPLDQALGVADIVSLHCPLTEQTRCLVNRSFLSALKPGALVINTSRGGLVDEDALAASLASGHVRAAALDVLSSEPPPPLHPLCDPRAPWASRVLVTPHIGWGTVEARARLRAQVVANLHAYTVGRRLNRVD